MADGSTAPKLEIIDTKLIDESPTNPRKTFEDIEDLAKSLTTHGQLEPALVRPHPKKTGRYELVFGARRYRGAKLAKLPLICQVRELPDAEVLEIQIIENSKRADVHPLEEAEGYEALLKTPGYTVEIIAGKVHKSASFVYGRLKLCSLCKEARKAYYDGKLTTTTATMIARIEHQDLQRQAIADLENEYSYGSGEAIPAADVLFIVKGRYMLRLADAPFDRADASLVPAAGKCTECPKRTGAQKALFDEVGKDDLCTDARCFDAKRAAFGERALASHKAKGTEVLSAGETKKVFAHGGSHVSYSSDFLALNSKEWIGGKEQSVRSLLKGSGVRSVVACAPDGTVVELVRKKEVAPLLKAAGATLAASSSSGGDPYKKQQAAQRLKSEITRAIISKVLEAAEAKGLPAGGWKSIARCFAKTLNGHDESSKIVARRKLEAPTRRFGGKDVQAALVKHVETLDERALVVFVVECIASTHAFYSHATSTCLKEMAALYKVDTNKIATSVKAELKKTTPKAKKKSKAKKGAKS